MPQRFYSTLEGERSVSTDCDGGYRLPEYYKIKSKLNMRGNVVALVGWSLAVFTRDDCQRWTLTRDGRVKEVVTYKRWPVTRDGH